MKPDVFLETKSLEEALSLWNKTFARECADVPLPPETVPVDAALGRVTAAPVSALISSPFYHAAAMDGYAVSSPETFGATETAPKRLPVGEKATYVNTGEALPGGANAVIMVEDVNLVDEHIEFIAPVTPWQNVRTVGEDIVATELICPESHLIRPVDLGALLAGGHTEVAVRRRPRVAIIPTGDEVVEPGSSLRPGNIIEFNSRVLAAMVTEWGGEPLRMDIVPDNPERLKEAVRRAAGEAHLVAVIAGASTGTRDHTHEVLAELGEPLVRGLRIKPGKPVMLGWAAGRPFMGIPGYPVSAYLTFELFAEPPIRRWLGLAPREPEPLRATLSRQVASALGQEEFLRMKVGRVGGRFIATPLGRGAGLVMSLARADAMLRIPPMSEGLGAGAEVEVELLRGRPEIEHTIVSIGSHDVCMDLLANALRKTHPRYSLSSAHVGSMGGLVALRKGEAHLAPTHLLDEETGQYNVPFLGRLLPDIPVVLVNLVHRRQGLMVLKGNPKGIRGFEDLARQDVSYVNRQRGAGTRLLLDKHLKELGIEPSRVRGYEREEYTHTAVASAVLSGVADAGLGVLSAARAMGLDFIPVAEERYDLAIPREHLETEMMQVLLRVIREDGEFRRAVVALGGYDIREMGLVIHES